MTRPRELGINANEDAVVTLAGAAAEYLRQHGVSTASVVGSEGVDGVYSRPDKQVVSYPTTTSVHFISIWFQCTIEGSTPNANEDAALDVGVFRVNDFQTKTLAMHPQWIADAAERSAGPEMR